MKGLAFILLIAVVGVGIWGNSQSKAKNKAIKEAVELKKEMSQIESKNKKLEKTIKNQKQEITNFKSAEKLLNAKLLLQKKSVEVLEGKISVAGGKKKKTGLRTGERVSFGRKKRRRKVSKEIRRSQDCALKITNLKHKIRLLNNQIEKYKSKARNAKYAIVKMTQADRKGWYRRKGGSKNHLESMKDLPRKWNRRDIRIVYISKNQKKEKLKQQYLKQVSKLQKEKSTLVSQLTGLQK